MNAKREEGWKEVGEGKGGMGGGEGAREERRERWKERKKEEVGERMKEGEVVGRDGRRCIMHLTDSTIYNQKLILVIIFFFFLLCKLVITLKLYYDHALQI